MHRLAPAVPTARSGERQDADRGDHADVTVIGMALTAANVVLMPLLGVTKHRLADRLGSGATAGEGIAFVGGEASAAGRAPSSSSPR